MSGKFCHTFYNLAGRQTNMRWLILMVYRLWKNRGRVFRKYWKSYIMRVLFFTQLFILQMWHEKFNHDDIFLIFK